MAPSLFGFARLAEVVLADAAHDADIFSGVILSKIPQKLFKRFGKLGFLGVYEALTFVGDVYVEPSLITLVGLSGNEPFFYEARHSGGHTRCGHIELLANVAGGGAVAVIGEICEDSQLSVDEILGITAVCGIGRYAEAFHKLRCKGSIIYHNDLH